MNTEILRVVGAIAGIGGIALGVFLLLFREVIRKSIFSTLSPQNSYRLMRWILILTWSVAVLGIVTYAYLSTRSPSKQTILRYGGTVKDSVTKLPLRDAVVSIIGRPDITAQATDRNGGFSFTLETATGDFQGAVQVVHPGYQVWNKALQLTLSATDEVYLVKEELQDFELGGVVRDENGAVEGARVSVKDVSTYSNKEGEFKLELKGQRGERFELSADKQGYRHWQENGIEARKGITIILERK